MAGPRLRLPSYRRMSADFGVANSFGSFSSEKPTMYSTVGRVGRLWKFQVSEMDDWVRAGGADEEQRSDGQTPSRKARGMG